MLKHSTLKGHLIYIFVALSITKTPKKLTPTGDARMEKHHLIGEWFLEYNFLDQNID